MLHDGNHLVEHVLRIAIGHTHVQRLESGANASDRAVVIGALDVDRALESALPFGDVIGDVGQEVGVGAVPLAHDAILVVAEIGRAQPQCAVVLVRFS